MIFAVSIATFFMTLLGGLLALRLKDRLHLILGFSAGAVIGVAFFDLIPEALDLAAVYSPPGILAVVALGFIIYMILDRTIAPHVHSDEAAARPAWQRGMLGAGSLAVHSFFDGFAIGLAFQVSAAVGAVVSAAVLVHDFSDGVNTVGIVLGERGGRRQALGWLLIDAAAPLAGAATSLVVRFNEAALGLGLALIAGFFLYISASDLLPESYHDHPTGWTTAMTILGVAVLYLAIRLSAL